MSYEVDGPTAKGFFRLIRSDQTAANLDTADFDGDALSNLYEITPRSRAGGINGHAGLNPNIQTSPLLADTDGDGLNDKWEQDHGLDPTDNGSRNVNNGPDGDNDGLTTAEEQALGTDPNAADSDNDLLNDSEDAVPLDSEINWKKSPESNYVWIEQIVLPTDNSGQLIAPVAVNSSGQILFPYYTAGEDGSSTDPPRNQLWNSAARKWTNLPLSGSQVIQIEAGLTFTADDQAGGFIDINDAGTVSGLARGGQRSPDTSIIGAHEISGTQAAMIWEKTGTPPAYGPPTYSIYHHTHPIISCPDCGSDFRNLCWSELDIGSHASTKYRWRNWRVPGGRIGMDGSTNLCANISGSSYNLSPVWLLRDGATTSPILGLEIKHFGASQLDYLTQLGTGTAFSGAILDKNRALFVETYGAASASTLWLKDGVNVETIATIVPSLSSDQTDIILAPSKRNDNTDRLWIAAGSKVLLEKLAGGSGANRWSEPTSMGQGAIRLNSSGLAITAGTPAQGTVAAILPKLWRNGLYTDLNKVASKPTPVTITEAIDLASNGIILVKATDNGVTKTGPLLPVEVVDKDKNPISKLKVGKMSETGVLGGMGTSPTLDIDKDLDRFFVRVKNGAALGGISIKVSTTDNPDAADYNDNATQIDLVADGADAISKSMLLVADDVDDDYPVDGVADDATGDRTHKIQLGGNFKIEEIKIGTGAWQALNTQTPVTVEKSVHLNIIRMADCNRGEIDADIKRAKERFAQVGIKFVIDSNVVKPVPLKKMQTTDVNTAIIGPFAAPVGVQVQALIDLFGTQSLDDVHVFYCKSVTDSANNNSIAGASYLEGSLSGTPYSKYGNNVLVASGAKLFTLAHELGHMLTNRWHFANPATDPSNYSNGNYVVDHNLMKKGTSTQNLLDSTKRLYSDQGNWIRSHRTAK